MPSAPPGRDPPLGPERRRFLQTEIARWVDEGIITPAQEARLLARYAERPDGRDSRRAASRIPAILIGLAVILIGVGLVLYYAANWRKMPPSLKLVQVFALLVLTHGGSFFLLFRRTGHELVGRGLLLLGMITFGAAIGLVAQIYHISAHPTTGILIWLAGTLLLSMVMSERWGYYLATLLAFIWNFWVCFELKSPNYPFPLVAVLLLFLFHRKGDPVGILLVALELLFWFYQVNVHWVTDLELSGGAPTVALLFLHLPLGVLLLALSRLELGATLRLPLTVLGAVGTCCCFAPLLGLSWPIGFGFRSLLAEPRVLPLVVEHAALTALAGVLLWRLRRRGEIVRVLAGALCLGAAALLAPVGRKDVLMVLTHLGLLGLILGLLWESHACPRRGVDRVLALFFAILALFAKSGGLVLLATIRQPYFLAYALGGVVFATLIFLIGQIVRALLRRRPGAAPYRAGILDTLTALAIFLTLYAASFRVPAQRSIFQADAVIILLLVLFVALALLGYGLLWIRRAERLPLGLSAAVFFVSAAVLFSAGPAVPWQAYSLVLNLLLFMVEAALITYSVRLGSATLANLAIAGFVLQIITRYFDLFWDLLSGSLLFIITGAVVFVGGFLLETNRRRVIHRIRTAGPAVGEDR